MFQYVSLLVSIGICIHGSLGETDVNFLVVFEDGAQVNIYLHYTANLCNQTATVVQLTVAITATFSFCNFWLQSVQLIGCKVKVHLLDANIASIT